MLPWPVDRWGSFSGLTVLCSLWVRLLFGVSAPYKWLPLSSGLSTRRVFIPLFDQRSGLKRFTVLLGLSFQIHFGGVAVIIERMDDAVCHPLTVYASPKS